MTERMIIIRRPFTVMLLLLVTAGIIVVTLSLSGKSYAKVDPIPFEGLRHLWARMQHRSTSTWLIAMIVMPIVGNIMLFLPFGFLLFLSLYSSNRPTVQTYVLTILIGFSFSCAVEAYQYFLPTRVADINDIIWNTAGSLLGAVLGHLRSRVRFEFE
jgi:glycopeptide antibiotics resistance protein